MSYDEDGVVEEGFNLSSVDDDELLDMPESENDFGLEDEDPESRYS